VPSFQSALEAPVHVYGATTVTIVDAAADGPLQPLPVTLTVAVPVKPPAHVTVAVVPEPDIVLPVPVTDQL
jgi:hypothetical protein